MSTETASRIDDYLAVAAEPRREGTELVPAQMMVPEVAMAPGPLADPRDEREVYRKIRELAAPAGANWFYSIPVRNRKTGQTEHIEGISIKGTNDVARLFGNCIVDCRIVDLGSAVVAYGRFYDKQTGYELVRPVQQSKGAARIGGSDDGRRDDMATQIAISKAQRNVVNNALQSFCDFAFEEAKASLVERIGKNLAGSRARLLDRLEAASIELPRVEAVLGRAVDDWRATDMAKAHALLKGVEDGMATASESFPPVRDNIAVESDPGVRLDAYLAGAGVPPKSDQDGVNDPDAAAGGPPVVAQLPEAATPHSPPPAADQMAEAVDKAIRLAADTTISQEERRESLAILGPALVKMLGAEHEDFVAKLMAMAEHVIAGKTPADKAIKFMRAMVR